MNLDAKRTIREAINKEVEKNREIIYARVVEVWPAWHYAVIKIGSSAKGIRAYYPENWSSAPAWLKIGSAVKCRRLHGRIEIFDFSPFIPAPYTGDTYPSDPTPADVVISGLQVLAPADQSMAAIISTGSVRFSGVTYNISGLKMGSSMVMGSGSVMGDIAAEFALSAAPSVGQFRLDIFVIGPDLTIDKVQGSASANPVFPAVPSGHLQLGWVLVYGGMTAVTQADVNRDFKDRQASRITMSIADTDLAWAELSTSVTINILDQYGQAISVPGGATITLSLLYGNGTISQGGESSETELAVFVGGSSVVFTYTRGQTAEDKSPILQATSDSIGTAEGHITLRDIDGLEMI